MYAKLKFNSAVPAAKAVRDIVRLITESAAGNASLSNLGSIDVSNSTLTAGVNSGWTLYTGQSIPTNSTAASYSSDSFYTLQATSATNSRTKYCAIHGNCHFASGSGMTYTSSNAAGILLSNVNDPTLANAQNSYNFGSGYSSSSTSYMNDKGWSSVSGYSSPLHIWADPTRIILYTDTWYSGRGPLLMGNFEGNQGPLDVWRAKCPTLTIYDSTYSLSSNADHAVRGRGDSYWSENYGGRYFQLHNMTSHGSTNPGVTAAHVGFTTDSYSAEPVYGSVTGTSTSGANMSLLNTWGSTARANSNIINNYGSTSYTQGLANHTGFDSSGSSTLVAEPLYFSAHGGSPTTYNFSTLTGTWKAPSNIGTNMEQVTIGSDTYTYVTMSTISGHSYLIKNT
jgi:hypothetical protein